MIDCVFDSDCVHANTAWPHERHESRLQLPGSIVHDNGGLTIGPIVPRENLLQKA